MDRAEEERLFVEHWQKKFDDVCTASPERRRELGQEALANLKQFDQSTVLSNFDILISFIKGAVSDPCVTEDLQQIARIMKCAHETSDFDGAVHQEFMNGVPEDKKWVVENARSTLSKIKGIY